MGLTVLIIFVAVIAVCIAVFFLKNKNSGQQKPEVNKPAQEPSKPDEKPSEQTQKPEKPTEPVSEEPEPQPEPEPEKPQEQPKEEDYTIEDFADTLIDFTDLLKKNFGGKTKLYLYDLFYEAYIQFYKATSANGLPLLAADMNFPSIKPCDPLYGDKDKAFRTLIGWLFALQLSEIMPNERQRLMEYGYKYGGYDMKSKIFGYAPLYDPNNMRILAASIYAAMRGQLKPDIAAMREEQGTSGFPDDLQTVLDSDACEFDRFYVDLRTFLPSAPGPYAPDWTDRPDSIPEDDKEEYRNLAHDREVHEYIVGNYNLDEQKAVQAIADKEADTRHLFGISGNTEDFKYEWTPAFGHINIGKIINPEGRVADLAHLCCYISSYAREILQSRDAGLYGRLRPGCSWTAEASPNSYEDLRRDVLTKFEIEDQDGNPTGYYDPSGQWVHPSEVGSADDYEWMQRRSLWANSYPSGHSAGIMGVGMLLMELMPERSDKILRATNRFAINRTIARYHWTSDTIVGRVVGSMAGALCRATTDFDSRLQLALREIS